MYCRDKFTIFLLSLRIGKQGFPLWFRCFKGVDNSEAFKISLINQGISYVHSLFNDKNSAPSVVSVATALSTIDFAKYSLCANANN